MVEMFGHIFVYGTLKQNQSRGRMWPIEPQKIQPAWTAGRLYDLGPYPALTAGDDRVLGEVWTFPIEDLARTFEVLDEIEGTNQPGMANEYDRVLVEVTLATDEKLVASTYHFVDHTRLHPKTYVAPCELQNKHFGKAQVSFSVWPRPRVSG